MCVCIRDNLNENDYNVFCNWKIFNFCLILWVFWEVNVIVVYYWCMLIEIVEVLKESRVVYNVILIMGCMSL